MRAKNDGATILYEQGHATVFGNAHFQHPWFVRNVMCADGHRRTAYANHDATEYRVSIRGIWYYGTIMKVEIMDRDDMYFHGSSSFQKIVHGYVVRYWMEEKDQSEQVVISVLAILNAVTRQKGIGFIGSSVTLSVNGHVKDTARSPMWLQNVRMRMISHPDSTWGDLVAIMKDAGVR